MSVCNCQVIVQTHLRKTVIDSPMTMTIGLKCGSTLQCTCSIINMPVSFLSFIVLIDDNRNGYHFCTLCFNLETTNTYTKILGYGLNVLFLNATNFSDSLTIDHEYHEKPTPFLCMAHKQFAC